MPHVLPMAMLAKRLVLAAILAPAIAGADMVSATEYAAERRKHNIDRTELIRVLDDLVGARIAEVKGRIVGTFDTGEHRGFMLERLDGKDPLVIEADVVPDWVKSSDGRVKAIVRAFRSDASAGLQAKLISVIATEAIPDLAAPVRRLSGQGDPVGAKPPRTTGSTTSRGTARTTSAKVPTSSGRTWSVPASEATPIYAAFARKQNPRLSQNEAMRIAQSVIGFSIQHGIDARLTMAVIMAESSFNPKITSHAGAGGLGQLMPGTAAELGVRNRYDPVENVWGMVRLLRQHLDKYNKQTRDPYRALELALAAYNAGPGAVKRHGGIPPYRETQRYVAKVTTFYRALCGE